MFSIEEIMTEFAEATTLPVEPLGVSGRDDASDDDVESTAMPSLLRALTDRRAQDSLAAMGGKVDSAAVPCRDARRNVFERGASPQGGTPQVRQDKRLGRKRKMTDREIRLCIERGRVPPGMTMRQLLKYL